MIGAAEEVEVQAVVGAKAMIYLCYVTWCTGLASRYVHNSSSISTVIPYFPWTLLQ